ncbi:unnamed protein product [Rhizophagus irregularis]|nr:unnamed protein product [Rhizophagus irregularis]
MRVNKIKYILMYFNNENGLMKAIYDSTMKESLQLKMQDELIGDSGKCGYRTTQVAGQTPNHNNELSKDEEQIEESSPSLLGMKVPSKKQSVSSMN